MPDDRKLFAVTQWVLRAGIIVTALLIGMYVLGVAGMIFGLSTSRLPLDRIAHWTGVTLTAAQIGRMALAAFAGAIAALALIHFILRALRRVVASARVGDPFIEANAAELVRVAWLLLGVQRDRRAAQADRLPARTRRRAREDPRYGPYLGDRAVRRAADLRAGADLQARQWHARRTRRDDLTWRSS